jgi:hypothetical protein
VKKMPGEKVYKELLFRYLRGALTSSLFRQEEMNRSLNPSENNPQSIAGIRTTPTTVNIALWPHGSCKDNCMLVNDSSPGVGIGYCTGGGHT